MILGKPRWPWSRSWTVRRLLTAALAAVAIFLYWSNVAERGESAVARDLTSAQRDQDGAQRDGSTRDGGPRVFGPSVAFADQRRLDDHFAKHGAEFGRISKQDYLRQAQLLRDTKVGGPVLEAVRNDGVVTRFDRETGAFIAFNKNGIIRTFFKPNDGERYWRRQMDRE